MSYTTVNKTFTTKNNVKYDLQYNQKAGGVQIIQQNAPPGTKPIYQDGKWNSNATTAGFSSTEQTQLHQQIIKEIQDAYETVGGVNSGAKIPQWIQESTTNNTPGQTSVKPEKEVTGNTGTNQGGGLGALWTAATNPAEAFANYASNSDKFGVGNESQLFGKGAPLTYPKDLMTSLQDHMAIGMYVYKPSKQDSLFAGDVGDTLSKGLQSNSNLEKLIGTCFLPMPNSITDSNNVSWGPDTMSNLAAAATANTMGNVKEMGATALIGAAAGGILGGGFKNMASGFLQGKNLFDLLKQGKLSDELSTLFSSDVTSKLLKMQGFTVEAESILARGAGIVPNSNLELLFNSPELRTFSFSYRLSPRSAEEAATVRRIIRFFKQGMAVKKMSGKSGEASFFLGSPNVFKLEYRSGTKGIDGVNKFKTCALTSFAVNYTPDGQWAAYDGGQPVSSVIQMSFAELEPIFDTDYQAGNIFENRNDLQSINSNSVGY